MSAIEKEKSMEYRIAVLPGDGIARSNRTNAAGAGKGWGKFNHSFQFQKLLAGGCAIDAPNPLPEETLEACKNSDAVLLGAVGGSKWDNLPGIRA